MDSSPRIDRTVGGSTSDAESRAAILRHHAVHHAGHEDDGRERDQVRKSPLQPDALRAEQRRNRHFLL